MPGSHFENPHTGYAYPVCAFSPVLGARCSALGVESGTGSRVPGGRYPTPGTRYLVPGEMLGSCFENPHTGYAGWWGWNGPWGWGLRVARSLLEVVGRSAGRGGGCAHRDRWDGGWPYAGTRTWVGGRRVSAGGGLGFAAVAAGEGPRAKRGRLYGRRSPRTIRRGLSHRLWPLKTLNENPGEIRRDGTSSSVHRKRVPTHRPDFPLIRRPRIRRREGCPPEEGSISQPIGPQEAQRDQDLRPPQRE